jgi:hypothetical protein
MGGPVGTAPFLNLNMNGKRFMNEDVQGQQIHNQVEAQPYKTTWQIYDSNWKQYIPFNTSTHGSCCYSYEQEEMESGKLFKDLGRYDCYCTDRILESSVEEGGTVMADSLEELVKKTGMPPEAALASIDRYNKQAAKGRDEDFGKTPKRLSPIEKKPFYATKFGTARMLVCCGGLESDADARCLDVDRAPIPGLYLAGNVQGNRLSIEYPTTVCGLSHSLALTFGYIAAETVINDSKQ